MFKWPFYYWSRAMPKNTLFNSLSEEKMELPSGYEMTLDIDKNETHYYRIECPIELPYVIKTTKKKYQLKTQHVSVFQHENRENPNFSQYHYTAKFSQEEECYRMHVYFDASDEFTKITFERKTPGGYTHVDSNNLTAHFIKLTNKYTKPLINKLKAQQNERINDLKTQYKMCDELLSKYFDSDEENVEVVLQQTKDICELLKKIIPLVRSFHYPKLLRFHEASVSMQQKFIIQKAKKNSIVQDQFVSVPNELLRSDKVIASKDFSEEKASSDTSVATMLTNTSMEVILALRTEYETLTQLSEKDQAIKIENLLARTFEVSLFNEQRMNFKDLQQLQKIFKQIRGFGADLLSHLLLTSQLDSAALLPSFYSLLPIEKYFTLALQRRSSEMLDLILSQIDFDINNQAITLKEIKYLSAIHYCLEKHTLTNPMDECLSMLIKHGASLLTTNEKGLPLAYSLFAKDKALFFKMLHMQPEKLETTDFFYKLSTLLRIYLVQENPSEAEANSIKLALKNFELRIERIKSAPRECARLIDKLFHQNAVDKPHHLLGETDPQIIELNKQYERKCKKFNSFQRKWTLLHSASHIKEIIQDGRMTSYESSTTKEEIIAHISLKMQIMDNAIASFEKRKEIQHYPHIKNHKYKQLQAEYVALMDEGKALQMQENLGPKAQQSNLPLIPLDLIQSLTRDTDPIERKSMQININGVPFTVMIFPQKPSFFPTRNQDASIVPPRASPKETIRTCDPVVTAELSPDGSTEPKLISRLH